MLARLRAALRSCSADALPILCTNATAAPVPLADPEEGFGFYLAPPIAELPPAADGFPVVVVAGRVRL